MGNRHLKQAYDLGAQKALADAGIKTANRKALLSGLGGAALGTGTTLATMPEDATVGERIISGMTGGMLGGAAGLTGFDRFGLKGALGGAALGAGASAGLTKLMPEGEGWGPLAGRALAEGTRGSLAATLLASSVMPGSSAGRKILPMLQAAYGPHYNPGRPVSSVWETLGRSPNKFTRFLDYQSGSPQMGKLVEEYGSIADIPASKYITGNIKDILGGAGVGAAFLPAALPAQALAEAGKERQQAEEGDWLDKIKYEIKQMRD